MFHKLLSPALIALTLCACLAVQAQTYSLPPHATPAGWRSIDGQGGGRLLIGTLQKQSSIDGAFREALKSMRTGYFDSAPKLVGAVRNSDRNLILGLFTTTMRKAPIHGALYSILEPGGISKVGVVFDHAQRFGTTYKPLAARFAESISAANAHGQLKFVVAPDGTEGALIPSNWQTQILQGGELVVSGPDQALVVIRFLTYFTDSNHRIVPGTTPLKFTADPVEALKATARVIAASRNVPMPEIHVERMVPDEKPAGTVTSAWLYGTTVSEGKTRRFETLVQVAPADARGQWTVQTNQRSAPAEVFERDLPLLKTIYKSYRYDRARMAKNIIDQANAWAEKNNAIFQQSMKGAAAIQASIDRSTRAFVDYLGDNAVVSNGSVSGRFNANTAAAIVAADPQNLHILSLNEYQ